MAEYNRLTSEHNFFEAGVEEGIEKGIEKTVKFWNNSPYHRKVWYT